MTDFYTDNRGLPAKSDLNKMLMTEFQGSHEFKWEEKRQYLGEFKERVLKSLTKNEVAEPKIDSGVAQAVADARAEMVIVHGDLTLAQYRKYKELAEKHNLDFVVRLDPEYQGDIGLVVVSGE